MPAGPRFPITPPRFTANHRATRRRSAGSRHPPLGRFGHGSPMSGPMAPFTVRNDHALMLDAIKGPDSRDWYSLLDDGVRLIRDRGAGGLALKVQAGIAPFGRPPSGGWAITNRSRRCARSVEPRRAGCSPISVRNRRIWLTVCREPVSRCFETLAMGGFWALLRAQKRHGRDRGHGTPALFLDVRCGESVDPGLIMSPRVASARRAPRQWRCEIFSIGFRPALSPDDAGGGPAPMPIRRSTNLPNRTIALEVYDLHLLLQPDQ